MTTTAKPPLSFWQIWNISFGFMGIQFGWGLQMANMSAIYEMLGAREDQLAMLWIAAPLTGLIIQPIVGQMSDKTWGRWGRRKPYFLVGAVLSSLALVLMPNSSALWMAVGLLWLLDGAINVTMQPFRAFVADLLPEKQQARGFAVQTVLIGIGAMVSSALPWMLKHWFGYSDEVGGGRLIPETVELAFYLGAAVLLVCVVYTIFTTKEYPPEDMKAFEAEKARTKGLWGSCREVLGALTAMPAVMRQLAWVQLFSWGALFCMWTYFVPTVARKVFGAADASDPLYSEGASWAGVCFSAYNGVALAMAFVLIWLVERYSPKWIHAVSLVLGGLGLAAVPYLTTPNLLMLSMLGVGIAWASILSMPYAMLASAIPQGKMGVFMGLFNLFIVIPQVLVALFSGFFVEHAFAGDSSQMVVVGGVFFILGGLLTQRVQYLHATDNQGVVAGSGGH